MITQRDLRGKWCEFDHEREVAIEWLKRSVEDMSQLPAQLSFCAYTHRREPHIAFANGEVKVSGAAVAPANCRGPLDLAIATLQAITAYRNQTTGPVLLVWRALPEFSEEEGALILYTRLAFDLDTEAS